MNRGQALAGPRGEAAARAQMTTLIMRFIKDHFVVTGPDVEPMNFRPGRRKPRTGADGRPLLKGLGPSGWLGALSAGRGRPSDVDPRGVPSPT